MDVILTKDIKNLGKVGTVVPVAPGYARNYLIPKGFAVKANKSNLKVRQWEKQHKDLRRNKEIRLAKELAKKIKALSLTIRVEVSENEKLYGSVSVSDIVDALSNEGFQLARNQILLEEPIKSLGIYNIPVKVHPEVDSKIKIWVVKK